MPAVGIPGATHGLARFLGGVDVGNEHAVGAEVEGLLDAGAIVVSADAHHRLGSAVGDAAEHGRQLLVVHGAVLGIDQQPIVAAVGQLFGDGGAVRVEEQAHLGRAIAQLLLEVSATEGGFGHRKFLRMKVS